LRGLQARLISPLVNIGAKGSHCTTLHKPASLVKMGMFFWSQLFYSFKRGKYGIIRVGKKRVDTLFNEQACVTNCASADEFSGKAMIFTLI
jgi:hypothetical protein